ncbi:heavy metal translocatin [Russula emetica]|nr:heavy metal translocatin [Russula emetica]
MSTSEHEYAHEAPSYPVHCVECPSAAEFACDARCQPGSCCQIAQERELGRHSIQNVVGDCIPDGCGGCQRSTPDSPSACCSPRCIDRAQEPCCQEDSNARRLTISYQDRCCLGSRQCCTLDSQNIVSHQEDDRCSDCTPTGQACLVTSGPNADREDNVVASATECSCCDCSSKGHSARGQCLIPTGSIADNENNVAAATAEDDCCSDCTLRCHPARGQVYPVDTGPAEKEDVVVISTVNTRHSNADHHHHSYPQLGYPRPEAKKQESSTTGARRKFSLVSEKGNQPIITEDAAEQGIGGLQTILLAVNGIDCPSCVTKLTKALLKLPSVQDVKVNIFTGQVSLTYREGFIFPSTIVNRATKATGFVCIVVDEPRREGKHRILHIKFQTTTVLPPVLPPGVVILKASRTESGVVFEVQYDAAVILPRSVLDIFGPLGGSFLPPSESNASAQVTTEVTSLFRRTLISAVLSIPVMVFSWAPLQPRPILYGAISLFLATCIQFGVGAPLYYTAFYTLFVQHILDMDVLVVLSSTIAYVLSLVAYAMQVAGHEFSTPFFETPTLLLTLITLGELISAYSRRRVTSALDGLGTLQPDLVQMVSADGATAATHVDLVQPHDVLRVAPNKLIPTDGIVLQGSTQVDESALTGESLPVDKAPGAPLTAGTRNLTSSIDMKANRAPAENTLAEFSAFLARLQEARLPVQDLADRVAALLAPVILAVAVVVLVIWIVVGLCVRGEHLTKASFAALRYTIAVLVVSCPCAILLCIPMVIVTTGAVATREGVLLKTATAIQQAKNTTVAVFDKTGTLTLGQMGVVEAHIIREEVVGTILALVSQDLHPVAQAVAKYLRTTYPHISAVPLPGQVQSIRGRGLEMTIDDVRIRGGNPGWLGLQTEPLYSLMTLKAMTMFAVTINKEMVAFFGLADSPRPSAEAAVETLQRQGIQIHIVSGDTQPVVCALAKQLGIPQERAVGGCLPEEKVARVRELQAAGGRVMFVGDGTNDTLALATADIGVAMGSGTDVARSAADVVFIAPDLARALAALLRLSRGAVRRVYLNFAWAAIYNLFAVLLAAGAFVKVRIAPEYAALGEMVSVVPVMLVAWSMWYLKF